MNKKLFILPLVTLLAACSQESAVSGMFANIRKAVSKENKVNTALYAQSYSAVEECYVEISDFDQTGAKQTSSVRDYSYTFSTNYMEGTVYAIYDVEGQPEEHLVVCDVRFENNDYCGSCDARYFGGSLKQAYLALSASVFQWNFKWASGDFAYLSGGGNIPSKVIKSVEKHLDISAGDIKSGSFTGILPETVVVTSGNTRISVTNYSFIFGDFKLTKVYRSIIIEMFDSNGYISRSIESENTTTITHL